MLKSNASGNAGELENATKIFFWNENDVFAQRQLFY
jgi:hypothetical protein